MADNERNSSNQTLGEAKTAAAGVGKDKGKGSLRSDELTSVKPDGKGTAKSGPALSEPFSPLSKSSIDSAHRIVSEAVQNRHKYVSEAALGLLQAGNALVDHVKHNPPFKPKGKIEHKGPER